MSLPQKDAKTKRLKEPKLICWGCEHQDDKLFPHPCRFFKRYQGEGHCTGLKPKRRGEVS